MKPKKKPKQMLSHKQKHAEHDQEIADLAKAIELLSDGQRRIVEAFTQMNNTLQGNDRNLLDLIRQSFAMHKTLDETFRTTTDKIIKHLEKNIGRSDCPHGIWTYRGKQRFCALCREER